MFLHVNNKFHCRRQSGMNLGYVTENGVNNNVVKSMLIVGILFLFPVKSKAYRYRILDFHSVRFYHAVIGQNMYTCPFCFLQSFSEFPMSLPVRLKPVNSLHLDHQKQISFVSFLRTMDQFLQMLHTSFCRCIREACYIIRLQSDAFHFYKSFAFL